jgi:hypothetical protein
MLNIKDLAVDKELDAREMAAVRGGHKFTFGDVNNTGGVFQIGDGNLGIVGNGNVVGDNNKVNNGTITREYYAHPAPWMKTLHCA